MCMEILIVVLLFSAAVYLTIVRRDLRDLKRKSEELDQKIEAHERATTTDNGAGDKP